METLKPILSAHPFLKDLAPNHLELLAGCASNVRFDTGHYLFREGGEANQFYFIRDGKVAIEIRSPDRGPIKVQTLAAGDVLGWSWLVSPYQWHFDAQAIELTRAIALDGKCLRTKCDNDHDLGYELMKRFFHILEQRLEAARLQLLDLYGNPI